MTNKTLEQQIKDIKNKQWFSKTRWWFTEDCVKSFFKSIKIFKKIKYENIKCPDDLFLPKNHFPDNTINEENITSFFISFRETLRLFDDLQKKNNKFKEDWINDHKKLREKLAKEYGCPQEYVIDRQNHIETLEGQINKLVNKKIELVESIVKMDQFLNKKL